MDDVGDPSLSAYCGVPLTHRPVSASSENLQLTRVVAVSVYVNRMATPLKGNFRDYAVIARRTCRLGRSMGPLSAVAVQPSFYAIPILPRPTELYVPATQIREVQPSNVTYLPKQFDGIQIHCVLHCFNTCIHNRCIIHYIFNIFFTIKFSFF